MQILYDYTFFKMYEWVSKMMDPFVSQVTTTIILAFFPLSIFYLVLQMLSLLGLYSFKTGSITSSSFILFIVLFAVSLIVNQVYFFAYKNWKEIILYFRKNEVTKKIRKYSRIYIVFCTSIYAILFLFLGIQF